VLNPVPELRAPARTLDLEAPVSAVEQRLAALGIALARNDASAIETEAVQLHRALAAAIDHFGRAARAGGVPPPLRHRLAVVGGQVAAQREALARATAALDRAIDVLLPERAGSGYAAGGTAGRSTISVGVLA
jgi:hypothetical protein